MKYDETIQMNQNVILHYLAPKFFKYIASILTELNTNTAYLEYKKYIK